MLVYFYAPWCPHCKQFAAQILADRKMQAFVQDYPHVRIYPDQNAAELELMKNYGAQGFPSFYVVLPNQKRVLMETHTLDGGRSRLKTPNEFLKAILKTTEGA